MSIRANSYAQAARMADILDGKHTPGKPYAGPLAACKNCGSEYEAQYAGLRVGLCAATNYASNCEPDNLPAPPDTITCNDCDELWDKDSSTIGCDTCRTTVIRDEAEQATTCSDHDCNRTFTNAPLRTEAGQVLCPNHAPRLNKLSGGLVW